MRPIVTRRDSFFVIWPQLAVVVCFLLLGAGGMQLLMAARAYVGGEGLWSKAQKDAVAYLIHYADSGAHEDYRRYQTAIEINRGDRLARLELEKPDPDIGVAYSGFLEGRNHPDDIPEMIDLFRYFRHNRYLNHAIEIWARGDELIFQLEATAEALHQSVSASGPGNLRAQALVTELRRINEQLTPLEDEFSSTLGEATRKISALLAIVGIAAAALLVLVSVLLSRRMLARLQSSETQLRLLVDNVPAMIAAVDRDWRVRMHNKRFGEVFVAGPSGVIGKHLREFVSEEQFRSIEPHFSEAFAGRIVTYEFELGAPGGATTYFDVTLVPERRAGGALAQVFVMLHDTTARMRAVLELRAVHGRLDLALQSSGISMWEWDARRGTVYLDKGWARLLGAEPAESYATIEQLASLVHPDDVVRVRGVQIACMKGSSPEYVEEHRVRSQSGEWRWIYSRGKVVERDSNGYALRMAGINLDITDRKHTQQALQQSEARYRVLFNANPHPMWVVDSRTLAFLAVNDAAVEHYGYSRDEFLVMTADRVLQAIEVPKLRKAFEKSTPSAVPQVWRHRKKSGEPIDVEIAAFNFEFEGRLARMVVVTDITERLKIEAKAQESEERYRMLWETTTDAIVVLDDQNRILYANPALKQVFGYEPDEVEGRGIEVLQPERLREAHSRSVARYLETGVKKLNWRATEISGLHRDGHEFPIEIAFSHMEIMGKRQFAGFLRDITDRKRAETISKTNTLYEAVLARFGHFALKHKELDELLSEATANVAAALNVKFALGGQFTSEGNRLVLRASVGWDPIQIGRTICADKAGSELGFALQSGNPVIVEDWHRETRFTPSEANREPNIRSGVVAIIHGREKPFGVLIVQSREVRGFTSMDVNLMQSIANLLGAAIERQEAEERLGIMAQFDTLTSLPNRSLFRDRLTQALAWARRNERLLALMFLDLDHFKEINDTLGHDSGDRLLKAVAIRLQSCLRDGDTIARLGGDEFTVILVDITHVDQVTAVMRKILHAFVSPFEISGHEIFASASIGIATFPQAGDEPERLLKHADIAMYRAKAEGGNTYQYYDEHMTAETSERLTVQASLRHALDRDELRLHYQPIVDLRTGAIVGVEALLRWQHPEWGLVLPGRFIKLAEQSGLIVPIGEWVLQMASAQCVAWQKAGLPTVRVAVNLSARQFRKAGLVHAIASALRISGMDGRLLELEITEGLLMENPQVSTKVLGSLKEMGILIAVDDFGTGYSSLSYLKHFPLDILKIDQSFVRDIGTDPTNTAIVRAIITLARSLGMRITAEGVETEAQLAFLRKEGCETAQGYLFSRPAPAEAVALQLLSAPVK